MAKAKKATRPKARKPNRTAAQRAATRRMIAANRKAKRPAASRPNPSHRRPRRRKGNPTAHAIRPIRRYRRRRNATHRARRPGHRRVYRRRSNPLTISNPIGKVPIIGTAIAMIGPAFFGMIGIEAIGQVHVLASKMGMELPEFVRPATYTIGGLLLAGVVQLLTFLPAPVRHSLGLAMASAGGAVDWYRYRNSAGAYGALELGDAGRWEVIENPGNRLGALELGDDLSDDTGDELGALELGALELGDYSGDAADCGDDLSSEEGSVLADEGYGAFHRRFIRPIGERVHHDPRLRRKVVGARWLWLAKRITPEGMHELANMRANQRLAFIRAEKAKEVQKLIGQGVLPAAPHPAVREVVGLQNQNIPGTFHSEWDRPMGWGPTG